MTSAIKKGIKSGPIKTKKVLKAKKFKVEERVRVKLLI